MRYTPSLIVFMALFSKICLEYLLAISSDISRSSTPRMP
jgi:hypothetical protein